MYLSELEKSKLREAIDNDTQFLCNCNIMDYSVLIGIECNTRNMVIGIVGIIAFIDMILKTLSAHLHSQREWRT